MQSGWTRAGVGAGRSTVRRPNLPGSRTSQATNETTAAIPKAASGTRHPPNDIASGTATAAATSEPATIPAA